MLINFLPASWKGRRKRRGGGLKAAPRERLDVVMIMVVFLVLLLTGLAVLVLVVMVVLVILVLTGLAVLVLVVTVVLVILVLTGLAILLLVITVLLLVDVIFV